MVLGKTTGLNAQFLILCSEQSSSIKIENVDDIPTVNDNGDGTLTLTQQDDNITEIFAQHIIYDFYQAYPNSNPNGELFKYYTLVFDSKDLMTELSAYADPDAFIVDQYPNTTISSGLVDLLNNKTYRLIKYCTYSSEGGFPCPEGEQIVPDSFELKIAFQFDASNNTMHAVTVGLSSCGNSFSIGMKGGYDDGFGTTDNTLQLWESEPGTSTLTDSNQSCHQIESQLYSLLDIGCNGDVNFGNIKVITDNGEAGQFVLERNNSLFAIDFITFEDVALSIEENRFNFLPPFQVKGNPYLQLSNRDNQPISIEIYNVSGQLVLTKRQFEANSIDLTNYTSGLYFIKLSDLNNQQKIFKFLKN